MRRFRLMIAMLLGALVLSFALSAMAAKKPVDSWEAFLAQVEAGATTITLTGETTETPVVIACDPETPITPAEDLTIIGNGHTMTDLHIGSGRVFFQDVRLTGMQGLDEEDGGAALTLEGANAIAVFSGNTRATGGASGLNGERGGDGVVLMGSGQGLLMRGSSAVEGGVGRIEGGCGVRVLGCGTSLLFTNDATIEASVGLGIGGSGVDAPACCLIEILGRVTVSGGRSGYDGGSALRSMPCANCSTVLPITVKGNAMLFGGIAQNSGHALIIEREKAAFEPSYDLDISGDAQLYGGAGNKAGSALVATGCSILLRENVLLSGGAYYLEEALPLVLEGCTVSSNLEQSAQTSGPRLDKSPVQDITSIVNSAIGTINIRYTPQVIEDGLITREHSTKYNGITVEKGLIATANVNGSGLKIMVFDTERIKRMDFYQWLMSDATEENGTRYVLEVKPSQDYLTVDATLAALNKLVTLGVTQLAYTTKEPVLQERIYSLAPIVEAAQSWKGTSPVERIIFGTTDDCVIFVLENGDWEYQAELTEKTRVELEPAA